MRLRKPPYARRFWQAPISGLAIALATFAGYRLHFNAATVALLYLLVIVCQSLSGGRVLSAAFSLGAAACLDYFFLPPLLSLNIADPLDVLAFVTFLTVSLVISHLVTRLREEAYRARRRGANLEQLHEVTRRLLLVAPNAMDAASLVKTFRDGFGASAVCLFEGDTAEPHLAGITQHDVAERTKQAYVMGEDADDQSARVVVRCLHGAKSVIGAIGLEGLSEAEWVAGPISVLAAAVLEQARAFRRASHETAAAQAEVFRAAILDALGHEFKTPLATILAVVGGLRESRRLGPDEMEMGGMIELEAARLNSLTDRLLRMARLDREEVRPRIRSIDAAALAEEVVHRYTTQSRDRRVAVICNSPPGEVPADSQLLDLALTQLLDNAFKYSVAGSPLTVEIGAEADSIAIRVRNEGSSIAPGEQDRIFERFYRGCEVRKLVSGAGLGLYVARKIAIAHGGSLDLEKGELPHAVVFCLRLPAFNNRGQDVTTDNQHPSHR